MDLKDVLLIIGASTACTVGATVAVGHLTKEFRKDAYRGVERAELATRLQQTTMRSVSVMCAAIVGATKITDIIDAISRAI